ncbi:MAG: hypothetical protein R2759_20805 [Bacteroidales bacterium]
MKKLLNLLGLILILSSCTQTKNTNMFDLFSPDEQVHASFFNRKGKACL